MQGYPLNNYHNVTVFFFFVCFFLGGGLLGYTKGVMTIHLGRPTVSAVLVEGAG